MELIFPLLILVMIGLVFMSSRQRRKQESQHKALQKSLAVGDVVVMTSGISGTVVDVDDERTIDLEIAPDVITTWLRAAVREKLVSEETVPAETGAAETVSAETGSADAAEPTAESAVPTETTPVANAPGDAAARDGRRGGTSDVTADSPDGVSSPRSS